MKLTKNVIKKLVMESLEESPLGGSPSVDSMTVTDPSSDTGENASLHKLEDGSFKLLGQGGEITLSPEDMKKVVAQYEEAVSFDQEHGIAEEAPVEEMSMHQDSLHEGRVTKSSLQKIIKEEYSKLLEGWGGFAGGGAKRRTSSGGYLNPLHADPHVRVPQRPPAPPLTPEEHEEIKSLIARAESLDQNNMDNQMLMMNMVSPLRNLEQTGPRLARQKIEDLRNSLKRRGV